MAHTFPQDITHISQPALRPAVSDADRRGLWFALALPTVMALLLAVVPIIGRAAAVLFLLTLTPLLLWAAFCDTEKAIYVYLAWCWMDGTIRGLLGGGPIAIVSRDIVMFTILLGWGLQRLMTRHRDPLRAPPGTLLVVLFVVDCLLQIANPYSLGLVACLGGFKIHFAFLPLLFIGYDVFRRREQIRALLLFLALATLVTSAVSVVQYQHGPAWTYAHYPGSKDAVSQNLNDKNATNDTQVDVFKPPGTTTAGGGAGAFVGVALPLTFALTLLSGRRKFPVAARAALGAGIFALIVVLFYNGVRSALLTASAGALVCALLSGGRIAARAAGVGAACVVLGLIGFNYVNSTSNGYAADRFGTTFVDPNKALHADRQDFFEQFGELVTRAPLGLGIGRVGGASQLSGGAASTEGSIFCEAYLGSMIAETGIPGALLIFAIAVLFLARGLANLRSLRDEDDRLLAAALIAILSVVFFNFFVSPVLLGLPDAPLFWLFGAILLRAYGPIPEAAAPAFVGSTVGPRGAGERRHGNP